MINPDPISNQYLWYTGGGRADGRCTLGSDHDSGPEGPCLHPCDDGGCYCYPDCVYEMVRADAAEALSINGSPSTEVTEVAGWIQVLDSKATLLPPEPHEGRAFVECARCHAMWFLVAAWRRVHREIQTWIRIDGGTRRMVFADEDGTFSYSRLARGLPARSDRSVATLAEAVDCAMRLGSPTCQADETNKQEA